MLQARLFAVRTEMADQEGEDSGQSNQSQQLRGGKYPPHPPGGIAPKKFQGEAEQGVGGQIDQQKGLPLPAPPGQAVQQKKEEQAAGGLIQLEVEDDGIGMDAEALAHIFEKHVRDTKSNGVGVSNVNERIRLFYGPEYGLRYESEPGRGTCAIVVIPAGKDVAAVENE